MKTHRHLPRCAESPLPQRRERLRLGFAKFLFAAIALQRFQQQVKTLCSCWLRGLRLQLLEQHLHFVKLLPLKDSLDPLTLAVVLNRFRKPAQPSQCLAPFLLQTAFQTGLRQRGLSLLLMPGNALLARHGQN